MEEEEHFILSELEEAEHVRGEAAPTCAQKQYQSCKQAIGSILELSEDELNRIEETLRSKIMKNSDNFMQKYDSLRVTSEKTRIEYEQHFIELESVYTQCQSRLENELKSSYFYKTKAAENGYLFTKFFFFVLLQSKFNLMPQKR